MSFEKREISGEIVGIIDIGTYKIRTGICNNKNKELTLIGYGEMRLSNDTNRFDDINELKNLCKNIETSIKKAELDAGETAKNFVINIPFEEVYFCFSKINYVNKDSKKEIQKDDLIKIVKEIESKSIKKGFKNIKAEYGYEKNDLFNIISNVSNISLDGENTKRLIGKTGENITLSTLNIFIPNSKFEIIKHIFHSIGKNLLKIIPSEIALIKLLKNKKNIIALDIGSCSTSILIKKDGEILGIKKISFGINELIKIIRNNYNIPKVEVIQSINQDKYKKEKTEFLDIFTELLTISLSSVLKGKECPNKFLLTGGGSNKFLKDYLQTANLGINNVNISSKIKIISIEEDLGVKMEEEFSNSNLNLYSMITATNNFIKKDDDEIEKALKEVIKTIH